jgi:hypothetical protein
MQSYAFGPAKIDQQSESPFDDVATLLKIPIPDMRQKFREPSFVILKTYRGKAFLKKCNSRHI